FSSKCSLSRGSPLSSWVRAAANVATQILSFPASLGKAQTRANFEASANAFAIAYIKRPRSRAAGQDPNTKSRHITVNKFDRLFAWPN
ncbi:MAG: hypothetical protein WA858_29570, partial [Xanthobacteraceae bacterium]